MGVDKWTYICDFIGHVCLHLPTAYHPASTPLPTQGSSPKPTVKFPEDVQVILRADRPTTGNLFIGNVEAA